MLQADGARILYEQPLSERMRAFLRLEYLFSRIEHALQDTDAWSCQACTELLIDVLAVVGRSDFKKELLKELERHASILDGLASNPRVDAGRLADVLQQIRTTLGVLLASDNPPGYELYADEFFSTVRQRSSIPAGTCDFDLPGYHFWLHGPADQRRRDLVRWFETFSALRDGVRLTLRLVRESAVASREIATSGFFQRTLDGASPCQMIAVSLPREARYYPEISAGRHRFTVRFMLPANGTARPAQVPDDVPFELLRCAL